MQTIRNIIIFIVIGAVLVLVYIFFIRKSPDDAAALISSSSSSVAPSSVAKGDNSLITQDFLTLLLSVKSIKLDDTIFSDPAFTNLDSSHSIMLTQDGTEGRPNPFAPLGSDVITTSVIP